LIDLPHDVMAATFGQLGSHQFEYPRRLREEIGCRVDDEAPRVRFPDAQDPHVNFCGLDCRLGPQRILVVVPVIQRRRPQVNHCVVAPQFVAERRVHGREEIVGAGPVRSAVDGSAVAEDNGRVIARGGFFKLPLDVKNGALRGSSCFRVTAPRESTSEDDPGGFGKNLDMLAKGRPPDEFERRRLAGTGAAGEDDTPRNVRVRTVAGNHGYLAV